MIYLSYRAYGQKTLYNQWFRMKIIVNYQHLNGRVRSGSNPTHHHDDHHRPLGICLVLE